MSDTQITVVDEIKSTLANIKDRLKTEGVSNVVFTELTNNAKMLQGKLDELMSKAGLFTQSDINDAYAVLQEYKRKELEAEAKKSRNRAIAYVGVGIFLVLGIRYILKRK